MSEQAQPHGQNPEDKFWPLVAEWALLDPHTSRVISKLGSPATNAYPAPGDYRMAEMEVTKLTGDITDEHMKIVLTTARNLLASAASPESA